jgi:hypothetical protein
MSTINAVSTTNNVNAVVWTYSTAIALHTDRDTSADTRHAEIYRVDNLGVGVTATDLFTLLV